MVYVDDMEAPFRGMIMCHMAADTSVELFRMADKIGVARRWVQHVGTDREHFDICKAKRALALKYGAFEVSQREMGLRIRAKASGTPLPPPRPLQAALAL